MAAVQQLIRKALQCRAVEVPQNLQAGFFGDRVTLGPMG